MKAVNIINFNWRSLMAALLLSLALGTFGTASQIFAHGGEDHGDEKPAVATTHYSLNSYYTKTVWEVVLICGDASC